MGTANTCAENESEINDSKKNQEQTCGGHVITASFPAELIKKAQIWNTDYFAPGYYMYVYNCPSTSGLVGGTYN